MSLFIENLDDKIPRKPVGYAPVLPKIPSASSDIDLSSPANGTDSSRETLCRTKSKPVKRKPVGSVLSYGQWKYYVMKYSKDLYMTTNPDAEHLDRLAGPSYYVTVDRLCRTLTLHIDVSNNITMAISDTEARLLTPNSTPTVVVFPVDSQQSLENYPVHRVNLRSGSYDISSRGFQNKVYLYTPHKVVGMMNLRQGFRRALGSKLKGERRYESSDEEDDHNRDMIGWIYVFEQLPDPEWSVIVGLLLFFGYSRRWVG